MRVRGETTIRVGDGEVCGGRFRERSGGKGKGDGDAGQRRV